MRAFVVVVIVALGAACASQPGAFAVTTAAPTPLATPFAQLEASRDLDGMLVGPAHGQITVAVVIASWCQACRHELAVFDTLRAAHPGVRWLGVNYQGHEEYAGRGSAETIRALARTAPWLRVVPADDRLFDAIGAPSKIPTVIVYDGRGSQVARYDRHERAPPTAEELDALLRSITGVSP
jgi:thiol-disulfide isomerase/thioredoxin